MLRGACVGTRILTIAPAHLMRTLKRMCRNHWETSQPNTKGPERYGLCGSLADADPLGRSQTHAQALIGTSSGPQPRFGQCPVECSPTRINSRTDNTWFPNTPYGPSTSSRGHGSPKPPMDRPMDPRQARGDTHSKRAHKHTHAFDRQAGISIPPFFLRLGRSLHPRPWPRAAAPTASPVHRAPACRRRHPNQWPRARKLMQ